MTRPVILIAFAVLLSSCTAHRVREANDAFNSAASADNALTVERLGLVSPEIDLVREATVIGGYRAFLDLIQAFNTDDWAEIKKEGLDNALPLREGFARVRLGQFIKASGALGNPEQQRYDGVNKPIAYALKGQIRVEQARAKIELPVTRQDSDWFKARYCSVLNDVSAAIESLDTANDLFIAHDGRRRTSVDFQIIKLYDRVTSAAGNNAELMVDPYWQCRAKEAWQRNSNALLDAAAKRVPIDPNARCQPLPAKSVLPAFCSDATVQKAMNDIERDPALNGKN